MINLPPLNEKRIVARQSDKLSSPIKKSDKLIVDCDSDQVCYKKPLLNQSNELLGLKLHFNLT